MDEKKLTLKVITPIRVLLETECDAIYSTAVDGEFGVLFHMYDGFMEAVGVY